MCSRHSANLNLHHKLLTKDSYGSLSLYPPSSLCRDGLGLGLDGRQDHRDAAGQTSVIFRGHNRMGLVFPMSKMGDAAERSEMSPTALGGGGLEDGAVLDLSTSSLAPPALPPPPRSGGSASWDSDGGGSEEEPLPMEEDSDESYDGIGLGGPGGEGLGL